MSEAATVEVCRVNIGPQQRARRRNFGIVSIAIGVVVAAVLLVMNAPRAARLVVALPLVAGAFGIFQAREKT